MRRCGRRIAVAVMHPLLRLTSARFRAIHRSPIFIVGCGHSGTTLMVRVIGAHPAVMPLLKETYTFFDHKFFKLRGYDLDCYRQGKRAWLEKTPAHIQRLGELFEQRPHARVILMLRDGRDVAVSLKERLAAFGPGVGRWVADNLAGLPWHNDPRVHVVRYEDLVADNRATLTRVCGFLGLAFHEDMLRFNEKFAGNTHDQSKPADPVAAAHHQRRSAQVNRPMFDGRARWVGALDAGEQAVFEQSAGDMMRQLGYAQPGQLWVPHIPEPAELRGQPVMQPSA